MRKLLYTILWGFASAVTALSQDIDSLKKVWPTLQDTAKADALNQLSYACILAKNKAAAEQYAEMAYATSKKLNYVHGLAQYYTCKAGIVKHFYDNFIEEEMFARTALQLYEMTPNKKGIHTPYYQLGFALFAQSRFEEAIAYLLQSYQWSQEMKDTYGMFRSYSLIAAIYREGGNYDKGFTYSQHILQMAIREGNDGWKAAALFGIGELYMQIGEYSTATDYFRQAFNSYDPLVPSLQVDVDYDMWVRMEFAELFSLQHQFDSALHYFNLFDSAHAEPQNLRVYLVSKGEYFLLQRAYYQALQYFLKALPIHQKLNDRNQVMRTLLDISKAYLGLHFNMAALPYAQEGLNIALKSNAKQFIRDAYQILYLVYDRWQMTDSAYQYFLEYINMKETIANDQIKARFAAYNYQQKINYLNKVKETQQARLEKEAFIKRVLSIGLFIFLLLSFIIFRNIMLKRKNEAHRHQLAENELQMQKLENQKQVSELEMQSLRAQMNPHFIFNCLNAINHFILKNEPETASDYLTKFSRLTRMILQSSSQKLISLYNELETLKLYLELEQVRFKKHFRYFIDCDEAIDTEEIMIPPLILQPFVENAIWHGLMHKEEGGHIHIEITQEDDLLRCTITDDGIGRKKAAAFKSKSASYQKSLGMQITAHRLQMLRNNKNEKPLLNIIDLVDAYGEGIGTKVVIEIPIKVSENVTIEKKFL